MTGGAVGVGVAVGPVLGGVGLGRAVGVEVGGGTGVGVGAAGVGTTTAVGVEGTVAGAEKGAVGVGGRQTRPEGSSRLRTICNAA